MEVFDVSGLPAYRYDDPSMVTFGSSQRYVSVLQSHRQEEEISRKHRSQRRARFVIGLTESYRRDSDEARNRLLKEKMSMRSQKEFSMLGQLSEITKWHEVIRANAASRQQVKEKNEVAQKEMQQEHVQILKEHLEIAAEHLKEDDTIRWKALVEKRKVDRELEVGNICRELVLEAAARASDVIGYAIDHDLPMPITESIPSSLFEEWQRDHLAEENDRIRKLLKDHVDLRIYSYNGSVPHSTAVVTMLCKALSTLKPAVAPSRPENPQPWPLIFITGPRYSGKSVIAETVANHLGMHYFSDESLVNAAMEELQQDFTQEDLSDPVKSDLVDIGHAVQTVLLEGGVVTVELMARLIGHCVRNAPEDCNGMIIDGVQMTIETVKAVESILSGYHDPVEEEGLLLAPSEYSNSEQFVTLLNVSRPVTAVTEVGSAGQSREKSKSSSKKKKEEDEPLPQIDLPPLFSIAPLTPSEEHILATYQSKRSVLGIARIVAVECDADQLFDRVAKIRFDVETGEEYHLDFSPPPEDRLGFLQIRDRPDQDCGNMFAQIEAYSAQWAPTLRWLKRFGNIQAVIPSGELSVMVDAFQDVAISTAEERRTYCHTVEEAKRILQHRDELKLQQREHNIRRDARKRQLLALYTERQVDPLPAVLTEPDWESTQPVDMTLTLANVLMETLSDFTQRYTQTVTKTHQMLNATIRTFHEHNDQCAERFELHWKQEDRRQDILTNFIKKDFERDRNLYILTATKEEMHFRIDNLQAELWRMVEIRKSEAAALIDQLCSKTTIVEAINEAIRGLGAGLVQSELDRFLMVRHLTLTYFSALKDAPVPMDLGELLPSEVIPKLKGGIATEKETEQPSIASGKHAAKKVPPKKGKGAAVQTEENDRPQDDMLLSVKNKATTVMEMLIDKLTIVSQAPAKSKKGVIEVTRADSGSAGALATPIVAEEMRMAQLRIKIIVDYFNGIADKIVIAQTARLYDKLAASLHNHFLAQLAAVNAAILYLRNCVEQETPPQCKLLLGLESFAEDAEESLFPPEANISAATEEAESDEGDLVSEGVVGLAEDDATPVTSCLTISRAHALIRLFKVCAPDYRLHKKDFVRIVKEEDYSCAGEEVVTVAELFDRFDDWGAGIIDWRLFIVHLLFWCEPLNATNKAFAASNTDGDSSEASGLNDSGFSDDSGAPFGGNGPVRRNKFYVDGPDFMSLLEMRGDLGDALIEGEENFVNADHFFGSSMPDESDEERFSSYCSVLWAAFAVDDMIDPQTFIMFLCPDEQPLRGMQKAFGVVSSAAADDNCALTPDLFDKIFHVFANNPRALGVWDPCSVTAQQEIFDAVGQTTIQFQDLCGIHAGRVILNNSKCYQRKSFVRDMVK